MTVKVGEKIPAEDVVVGLQQLDSTESVVGSSRHDAACLNKVEAILAEIWQEVLAIVHVDRADNFFDLGGNSLHIVRMRERLRRVGLTVDVTSIYNDATLWKLAQKIRTNDRVLPDLTLERDKNPLPSGQYDEGFV